MLKKSSLKGSTPEVRNYIHYLELENKKLQRQVAKLQVANLSISNKENEVLKLLADKDKKIKALENRPTVIIEPPN
jgi:hypothetical protein